MASIYWMNGMAGTGKTTIAYSVCAALEANKQLAASFFCTRASSECRDAKRIVPTIVYQLARLLPSFRSALCMALEEHADSGTGTIYDQFDKLLKIPLQNSKENVPRNLVVVVDALDECEDPYVVELFLGRLFRSVADFPIKFFVTSRPEPAIRQQMMAESESSRSILYLHEIEKSLVQADIELYLKEELASLHPSDNDIKRLASQAHNLFIYAATAVRYIRPPGGYVNSKKRLKTILTADAKRNNSLAPIDTLYTLILKTAIEDELLEPGEQEHMQLVIWTVVCAREPLLINSIAAISGIGSKDDVGAALQGLRSVLHVSEHSEIVTTLHASFPEYIMDRERAGCFACSTPEHNRLISEQCLNIMKTQLRFNICAIQSSFIPDDNIPNLRERVDANISGELFYTCRFWVDHLMLVASNPQDLTEACWPVLSMLRGFLSEGLLFWMEVLNLKKCMFIGISSTSKLVSWLSLMMKENSTTRKLASNAQAFVIGYASRPISEYTAHIYLSALPFDPYMSCYLSRFKGLVRVSGEPLNKINYAVLSTWEAKFSILSVAFSPSGRHVVSGSYCGMLCAQDARDGKHLFQPFKAHRMSIRCVAVSRDGAQIVTGSKDMTLSVWDAWNGTIIAGPFKGHTNSVESVAFSPDGAHIASGSEDHTVGIWISHDATTDMRQLRGHVDTVDLVAFSPDGFYAVSGSSDRTIRLWDPFKGISIITLLHEGLVKAVQFSLDGSRIISGSVISETHRNSYNSRFNLRVWATPTGTLLQNQVLSIHHLDVTTQFFISPSGDIIAVVTSESIKLWDMRADKLVNDILEYYQPTIRNIAFSDDGTRIVVIMKGHTTGECTVAICNAYNRACRTGAASRDFSLSSTKAISFAPDSACFATKSNIFNLNRQTMVSIDTGPRPQRDLAHIQLSLDGTRMFSIHTLGTICTWNAHTGKLIDGPYRCSTVNRIRAATCSFDGKHVVSHSQRKLEVWNMQSNHGVDLQQGGIYDPDDASIFSQEGSIFFTNVMSLQGEATVHIWDAGNGRQISEPHRRVWGLGLSPDGSYIVCAGQYTSRILLINVDTEAREILFSGGTHDELFFRYHVPVQFSSDGLCLAYAIKNQCYVRSMHDRTVTNVLTMGDPNAEFKSIACFFRGWFMVSNMMTGLAWVIRRNRPRVSIRSDGWLIDSQSRPLFWVPLEIRANFPTSDGCFMSSNGVLFVEYGDLFVGDNWSRCYDANALIDCM